MKNTGFIAALFVSALYQTGTLSAGSTGPYAHNPEFQDKTLWPAHVPKTAYFKETWKPARVLVFVKGGDLENGNWRNTNIKEIDAVENWEENGKPATEAPDENTDLIFPESKNVYVAGYYEGGPLTARHITVGKNARIDCSRLTIHGNLWVKGGGNIFGGNVQFVGSRHTFMRNDGNPKAEEFLTNKLDVLKAPNASVETLGRWAQDDEMRIRSGTLVLGPDTLFQPGDRGGHRLWPKANLVLMSGSRLQSIGNKYEDRDWVISGNLLAGTADRPLTADTTFGLSFKVHAELEGTSNVGGASTVNDTGLALNPTGRIAVTSADPKKARLIFCWSGRAHRFGGVPQGLDGYARKEKIKVVLLGKTDFNGVEFRDFRLGGIAMSQPSESAQWKNTVLGEKNEGPLSKLIVRHEGPTEYGMDR